MGRVEGFVGMASKEPVSMEINCPCCGARLTVDPELSRVIYSAQASKPPADRDLDHAADLLRRDAARRDQLFEQSVAEEKVKSDLLDRKFQEALKRSQGEPVERPLQDLDLD
jgi:hypothetical protein